MGTILILLHWLLGFLRIPAIPYLHQELFTLFGQGQRLLRWPTALVAGGEALLGGR